MDGKTICPHRLIRSGRLDGLTEEDMRILLDEYDVKTVVDFRTDSEREETPDPDLENVTILLHSILDAREMGALHSHKFADLKTHSAFVDAMHAGLIDPDEFFGIFYRGLISSPHAIENFRAFFETLLKQETGAVLWHCTAGKDRTGIATVLLLFALGVSQEDILYDYLITNTFLKFYVHHTDQPKLEGNVIPMRKRRGVQESYFVTALAAINDNFGSMKQYLEQQMGLTPQKIDQLKALYLR